MLVNLFSPRGIPADYRHQQGVGVNTYRWVNAEGESHLVKYHWLPHQGVRSLTEEDAANIRAGDLGHASKTSTTPSSGATSPSGTPTSS